MKCKIKKSSLDFSPRRGQRGFVAGLPNPLSVFPLNDQQKVCHG